MKAAFGGPSGGSMAPGLDVDLPVVPEPMQSDHTTADLHVRTLRATANRGVPDLHIRPFRAKRVALEQGEHPAPYPFRVGFSLAEFEAAHFRHDGASDRQKGLDVDLGRHHRSGPSRLINDGVLPRREAFDLKLSLLVAGLLAKN